MSGLLPLRKISLRWVTPIHHIYIYFPLLCLTPWGQGDISVMGKYEFWAKNADITRQVTKIINSVSSSLKSKKTFLASLFLFHISPGLNFIRVPIRNMFSEKLLMCRLFTFFLITVESVWTLLAKLFQGVTFWRLVTNRSKQYLVIMLTRVSYWFYASSIFLGYFFDCKHQLWHFVLHIHTMYLDWKKSLKPISQVL